MRFTSNSYRGNVGFKASYYQIPCQTPNSQQAHNTILTPKPSSQQSSIQLIHEPFDQSASSGAHGSVTTGSHSIITVLETKPGQQSTSGNTEPRIPCDLVVYDMFFELSSPGYPYSYPTNADCLYSVRRLSDRV